MVRLFQLLFVLGDTNFDVKYILGGNVSMNITYGNSLCPQEVYPLMEKCYSLPERDVATQKYYLYVFLFNFLHTMYFDYILPLLLFPDPLQLPTHESPCTFNPHLTPVGAEET